MKKIESEYMICFLQRPAMYVGIVNRDNIISFMHGVDFGRRIEPSWTALLKEFISSKFNINAGVTGWPYQVERYGEKNGLNWTDAFKKLMLQLIEESNQIPYTRKLQILNQKLVAKPN